MRGIIYLKIHIKKSILLSIFGIFYFIFLGNTHFAGASILQSDLNKNGINDADETEAVLNSDATLPAGEYVFNNLTITNNATLSLLGDPLSTNTFKGVKITATNLIVNSGSSISAGQKGYGPGSGPGTPVGNRAGASYGGVGGWGGVSVYGSAIEPLDLGSGGPYTGRGGGAIYVVVTGVFTNNGIVSANGGGSSSGGSIYVITGDMVGAGTFQANGGSYSYSSVYYGQGGGGRIAVYYQTSSFSGQIVASGGCGSLGMGYSYECGGSGTSGLFNLATNDFYAGPSWHFQKNDEPFNFKNIYISNNAKITSENGAKITANNIFINNNSSFTLADNQILNIPTITVDGSSILTLSGSETIIANSLIIKGNSIVTVIPEKILSLTIPNISISSGASISAYGKGYGSNQGPGAPVIYYAGASYGGVGYLNSTTSTYGSETEPTDFGSGGSYRGGGAIKLVVSDSLVNDGTITADGEVSGSGGGILINANNITGTGKFSADGGGLYASGYFKGPGGGGRIALYYQTSSFNGTVEAKGGCGSYDGYSKTCAGDGTVVMEAATPIRNPVLIVPGVLGTEISKTTDTGLEKLWLDLTHNLTDAGDDFMDPLQFNSDLTPSDTSLTVGDVIRKTTLAIFSYDYTNGLIKEFQNQGYTEGADLFLFPYDWRYGVNEDNVNKLKQKITDVLTQTGAAKVDVIAHSTGGLLVKKYVIENQSNNHIGKTVFVGVPNTGAPKAIKALIQGDNFGNLFLADSEMKKIAKNLPIAYDLSPSEQYFNIKGSYVKIIKENGFTSASSDLDFNETSSFLTQDYQLNSQALINAHNLHTADFDNFDMRTTGIDLYAVDGCKAGTIGKFIESRYQNILGGNPVISYTLESTPGDGTVPLESATNLPINQDHKYYALKAEHGKMLSQDGTRQEIVNIISGSSLAVSNSLVTQDISKCKLNGKAISVFSPLSIDVVDQDGNHSGLAPDGVSIENNIPNADFEIMGEHKFVYLPNDEGQTYTINVKGTGNGVFTIKDQDVNDNQVTQTQVFSNIPVATSLTGQINLGAITILSLDNNGDGTTDQIVQPFSILDSNTSQDLISPISIPILTGLMGQPNFYRGDVNINLSAIDPVIAGQENQTSGILETVYKLDNDSSHTTYVNPIAISSEGKHTLKFFSTDKAGNNETEKSIDFTIDKTAPEFSIQFNPTKKDLKFTGIDNISDASAIGALDHDNIITLIDQAGNTSQMTLKDKNRQHQLKAEIKSLAYNNQLADIVKNKLAFNWKLDKQQNLKEFKQHVKSKKDFNIDAVYRNGKTSITGKDQDGRINKLLDGLILLEISTDNGDLNWSY